MKKLKILYTIPNFDTAGSGKVVYDLVKGLDKEKFEVEIACSSDKGDFFKEIVSLNMPIHIVQTTTSYRPYMGLYNRIKPIAKFFKKNKYDIIHSWHWSSDWTEVLAARWAGAKWIYTKKAMSWGNKHWKIRSFLANFIITINDEMHTYFSKKKHQKLIPLGIDTEYYSPLHFKAKENRKTFNIITIANLVPVKGVEVLIKAIAKIDDDTIVFTVLGDYHNPYGKYLLELCNNLGIQTQVKFLGKKTDIRPFIVQSDLYIIPTLDSGRKEGMPMALVEAMSMGIPVLGSDISGIRYVLKDFPNLLVRAADSTKLSDKILKFRHQSKVDRQELGITLRDYCIVNFNMKKFIDAHELLYLKLSDKKE